MLKLSLVGLFVLSLATLSFAASAIPAPDVLPLQGQVAALEP